jgi:hypothetical protein
LVQTCSFIKSLMTIKQNVTPELIYVLCCLKAFSL